MKLSIPFFDAIVAKNANDLYFMGKFLLPQFLEKGSKVAQKMLSMFLQNFIMFCMESIKLEVLMVF